jgi:hypothetical protein
MTMIVILIAADHACVAILTCRLLPNIDIKVTSDGNCI